MYFARGCLLSCLVFVYSPSAHSTSPILPDATKALAALLVQRVGKETLQDTQKDSSTQTSIERLESKVSCRDLIHGTLDAPRDAKAVSICETAKDYCLIYAALLHLDKKRESPFPKKETQALLQNIRISVKRWRAYCEGTHKACKDRRFLESIFDARQSAGRDHESR